MKKTILILMLLVLAVLLIISAGCSKRESVVVVVPQTGSSANFKGFKGLPVLAPAYYEYIVEKEENIQTSITMDFYGFEKIELQYVDTARSFNGEKYIRYEYDNGEICYCYFVDGKGNVAVCSKFYPHVSIDEADRITEEKGAELATEYLKKVIADADKYSVKETLTYTGGVPDFWVFCFEREADGVTVSRILITVHADGEVTGYENYSGLSEVYYEKNPYINYKQAIDIAEKEIEDRVDASGEELFVERRWTRLEAIKSRDAYVVSVYSISKESEPTIDPFSGEEETTIYEITVYVYVPVSALR